MSDPTTDNKLASDEARRAVQHDAVKARVEGEVNAEIADRAAQVPAAHAGKIDQVAGTFRKNAVDEVVDSERNVQRSRGVARVSQFIDYAFFLIYALLVTRFVLSLIGARTGTGFVKLIVNVTDPLYGPFKNIVASPRAGEGTLLLPAVVALAAYLVLHLAINRLLRLVAVRKTEI